MARETNRLTARTVTSKTASGLYGDGNGLYLQVTPAKTKSWVYRFMMNGRAREMGLGSVADVALAEARQRATEARKLVRSGVDPIEHRKATRATARVSGLTFKTAAERFIESHKAGWRNEKHAAQWRATLATYVDPVFGDLPVASVDTGMILRALEPIWSDKPETASRVRGRIESILDWAKARGLRGGENPARWRGHLDHLLPARAKVRRVVHHPALPHSEIGAFMAKLRNQNGTAAAALEFAILTATRTSETIGARWSELDPDAALWTIPADRIKAGRAHRVPLSPPALAILKRMRREHAASEFVFPGKRGPLSNMALLAVLKRMGRDDITTHGFRSTFRDWAAETTNYPREVAEAALAHVVGDKVEAAYRRGDLFEKRRRLMAAWAKHCATPLTKGDVVPLRRAKSA